MVPKLNGMATFLFDHLFTIDEASTRRNYYGRAHNAILADQVAYISSKIATTKTHPDD